jgi:hypothetical protein
MNEQWYPPVLPVLLTIFPQRFLEKYHWAVCAVIDVIQVVILYLFSYFLTKDLLVASLAGLLYANSPILVTQNSNLNSRALGSLILTFTILSIYAYLLSSNTCYLALTIFLGTILLYTHRFASQQMLFLFVGLSILYMKPVLIFVLAGIYLAALVLLKDRFYLNTLRGHIQILKYWKKNLSFLGAHQVYHSPIYKNDKKAKEKKGCTGIVSNRYWSSLAKSQLLFLLVVILYYAFINRSILSKSEYFFLNWFLINFLSIIVISYYHPFKFLGEGYRYFMYGVFPVSFLLPRLIFLNMSKANIGIFSIAVFFTINLLLISKIYASQKKNILATVDADLHEVMGYIKKLPRDNMMCLPASHCEHIAYFCRKKVLWGGHSYGYDKVELIYPVLLKPIEYFIQTYNISYCLLNQNYVSLPDLRLSIKYKIIMNKGQYCLVEF